MLQALVTEVLIIFLLEVNCSNLTSQISRQTWLQGSFQMLFDNVQMLPRASLASALRRAHA